MRGRGCEAWALVLGVGVGRWCWAWAWGVGVGVGRGRGWRLLFFVVNFDVVTVRKVSVLFVGQ